MGWLRRLSNTVPGSPAPADLEEEVRFHFDRRVDDYMRQGLSRGEAIRAASRRLVALGQQSLVAQMMVLVGLLAIVPTVVGLYGVIAYLTSLARGRSVFEWRSGPPARPCS